PASVVRTRQPRLRDLCQLGVIVTVALVHHFLFAGFRQTCGRKLADGLEHPIPRFRQPAPLFDRDQRAPCKAPEQVESRGRADGQDSLDVETPCKHGELAKESSLRLREQLVAPLERRKEGGLPAWGRARPAWQPEVPTDVGGNTGRRQGSGASCCQLD